MHIFIGQRFEIQLINRVARVGNQLAQENFLIGIDGVNHQIQHPLGLGFKLLFCHTVHRVDTKRRVKTPSSVSFLSYIFGGYAPCKLKLALVTIEC